MACRDRGPAWSWLKSKKRIRFQTFLRISIRFYLLWIYRIQSCERFYSHMTSSHSGNGIDPWAEWWLLKACLWLPTSPCRARAMFAPWWSAVVTVLWSLLEPDWPTHFEVFYRTKSSALSVDSISQRLCLPFAAAATLLLAWPLPVKASLKIWQPIGEFF